MAKEVISPQLMLDICTLKSEVGHLVVSDSVIISRAIHAAANGVIPFFSRQSNIPLCVHRSSLSMPLLMGL